MQRAMDLGRYRHLRLGRCGRVLTIALNRPDQLNAVDGLMHEELADVFLEAEADPDSDVVVLTGEGRAFSAGGDLAWLEASTRDGAPGPSAVEGKRIVHGLLDMEKPVIARVNGHCIGLGCTLALLCDVVIAVDRAKIGDPHVRVGLVAGDGGAAIWPQLVGFARAKEYLMTGDLMPAAEAERIGLVNRVVPDGGLDAAVYGLAERLSLAPQQAVRGTKVAVNAELKRIVHAVMAASIPLEQVSFLTADHREAVAAFKEKREPRFGGR
jgi:enoyl-CoA hydratase